jgi:DNA/RNA endonuclease G (NUC1)
MARFITVFFTSTSERIINKNYKKVIVVEAESSNLVSDILTNEHNCTYIKSIRDLNKYNYYMYDIDIDKLEKFNNYKLGKDG